MMLSFFQRKSVQSMKFDNSNRHQEIQISNNEKVAKNSSSGFRSVLGTECESYSIKITGDSNVCMIGFHEKNAWDKNVDNSEKSSGYYFYCAHGTLYPDSKSYASGKINFNNKRHVWKRNNS